MSIRQIRMARPKVRVLEPRWVLNATAELTAMGELLVTGSDAADTVELSVEADGGIQLRDGDGATIAITNHPGDPNTSLNSNAVTSGQIRFDLGGGDDRLRLDIPSRLSITVLDSDGDDSTEISRALASSGDDRQLHIRSESIAFNPSNRSTDLRNVDVSLNGIVSFGQSGQETLIDLGSGSLIIDGRLNLIGDVAIQTSASIDLTNATLSAVNANADLRITSENAAVSFGSADSFAGLLAANVSVASASSVNIGSGLSSESFVIGGDLDVRDISGDVNIDAPLSADSVHFEADQDIRVDATITTLGGDLNLFAGGEIMIDADLSTASADRFGMINLAATSITLSDAQLETSGGSVALSGLVAIDGIVVIDSGDQQTSDLGGRIEFLDTIEGLDGVGDSLILDSRGQRVDGAVRLQGAVGRTDQTPSNIDLNSLVVTAGQIETQSIGISGGNLSFSANSIRMFGDRYETRGVGDILLDARLRLPVGNTTIVSAGSTRFIGDVQGQDGTNRLQIDASADVVFSSAIDDVGEVAVRASGLIQFDGPTSIRGNLTAIGDTVRVRESVDTGGGSVRIDSASLLSIENQAVVSVAGGTIAGDGGGGVIDVGGGTLQSTSTGDAITLRNASRVILGQITADSGRLTLGIARDITGLIDQAPSTSVVVDRLVTSNTVELRLTNAANDFVSIEQVRSGGPVRLVDSIEGVLVFDLESTDRLVDITATGDIVVRRIDAGAVGDIELKSDDDILDSNADDENRIVGDALSLVAKNLIADGAFAIRLSTNINQLQATVMGPNRGDLLIDELDSIELAASNRMADEIIQTKNGQVTVHAGVAIKVIDNSVGDDNESRTADPEIVAAGDHGRIELVAGTSIELSDDVQLSASQITKTFPDPRTVSDDERPVPSTDMDAARAVLIDAPTVMLGERIQIDTGDDQGRARVLGPRPVESGNPLAQGDPTLQKPDNAFAFFDPDPDEIVVNILEQALVNDATGILMFNIGQAGERGLTVDIDWGAATRRFQQINGLSADQDANVGVTSDGTLIQPTTTAMGSGRITVSHFYSQADIVFSTLNGRTAATEPLNVRFAVRQHESILVRADTIVQSNTTGTVANRIASSSDSIESELIGSQDGRASFIIPSLSIPVAFFPVRDVIPEIETPTFVVRTETSIPLVTSTVETVESTTVSIVSRDEYFQLRVLSPDPDGKDLADPKRLPDDILNGDQIKKLFAELPDGAYEIEYVLGDGNQRSILKVDVRNGEAAIPDGDLDEGKLKLTPVHEEQSDDRQDSVKSDQDADANRLTRASRFRTRRSEF